VIDWSFILFILAIQMVLLFPESRNRKDSIAFRPQTKIGQVLIEWTLYMLVLFVFASILRVVLNLMCSNC
jgi:succinate-acetate transporter protein